jgi:hypothetical protein
MSESEKHAALKETLHDMLERYKSDANLLKDPKLVPTATAKELPPAFIKKVLAATDKLEKACLDIHEALSTLD